jgi:hypothetical protein
MPRQRASRVFLANSRVRVTEGKGLARTGENGATQTSRYAAAQGFPEAHRLPMLVRSSSSSSFGVARMTLALGHTILGAR